VGHVPSVKSVGAKKEKHLKEEQKKTNRKRQKKKSQKDEQASEHG
jgi:hypothetical protein